MHNRLATSVLASTCSWFDGTPVGRIANRFSQDIGSIDGEMMMTLMHFVDCILGTAQVFVAISMTVPFLLVALLPVIGFIWWTAFLYIQCFKRNEEIRICSQISSVCFIFRDTERFEHDPLVRI